MDKSMLLGEGLLMYRMGIKLKDNNSIKKLLKKEEETAAIK